MSEQPRVPAAPSPNPHGGEWTRASSGGVSGAVSSKGDYVNPFSGIVTEKVHPDWKPSKEGVTPTKVKTNIDLGGGNSLVYDKHPMEGPSSNTWQVYHEGKKIGEITLDFYKDIKFPSIRDIRLDAEVRGKGLGRKVVKSLAKHYGGVTSDPQGNTNDMANKMWSGITGVVQAPNRYSYTKNWMWQIVGEK